MQRQIKICASDDVPLSEAVTLNGSPTPEPASMLLFGSGAADLGGVLWRRPMARGAESSCSSVLAHRVAPRRLEVDSAKRCKSLGMVSANPSTGKKSKPGLLS